MWMAFAVIYCAAWIGRIWAIPQHGALSGLKTSRICLSKEPQPSCSPCCDIAQIYTLPIRNTHPTITAYLKQCTMYMCSCIHLWSEPLHISRVTLFQKLNILQYLCLCVFCQPPYVLNECDMPAKCWHSVLHCECMYVCMHRKRSWKMREFLRWSAPSWLLVNCQYSSPMMRRMVSYRWAEMSLEWVSSVCVCVCVPVHVCARVCNAV